MFRLRCSLLVSVLCLLTFVSDVRAENDPQLEAALTELIDRHEGDVSIAIKQLDGKVEFLHEAQRPMPTASLIKLAVMIETYRQSAAGEVSLDDKLTLRDADKVPGSGILTTHFSDGMTLSLRDAVRLMMVYSDNTATNLVLDRIGLGSTSATMEKWNLPQTKIHAKVFRRESSLFPKRSQEFGLGSTTAAETVTLLEKLHRNEIVSEEVCIQMREHLLACADRSKLARFLPANVKLAHKGGAVNSVRCDAGILYAPTGAVAICVLTRHNKDKSWGDQNGAEIVCGRVGEIVYKRFSKKESKTAASRELKPGTSGEVVEELQRTLNARLEPSPELAIDGEFGSVTEAAVRRFQTERKLPATGIADTATLKELGPLLSESAERAERKELPELKELDSLDGPPFVTCKGWVLVDAHSGEVLAGHEYGTPLPMASTTKMMTAYLAFREIANDPELAESIVTFSERADNTRGSTAGLRAGEQIPLRELLYGLLLPSGNDASVAIAEHLGDRFPAASDKAEDQSAYSRFIQQMNATAKELGMVGTHYENSHGLDAKGHQASPRDLAKLARAALELEEFRQTVSTRRHQAVVENETGSSRQLVWNNTNKLLDITGYGGVKTGTTSKAGACLVSYAQRDGKALICVVLGSQSSGARYIDSRNLFRWGFRELLKPARN